MLEPRPDGPGDRYEPADGWYDDGPSRRPLASLWLGGVVACLTALGLVVGMLDGGEPVDRAAAADPSATSATSASDPSSAPTAVADSSVPAAEPAATVPVVPVIVAGASIPPVADMVSRVGGGRVEVVSIVPQGVDGHTYEPSPSDVTALARANVNFLASATLNPAVTRTAEANLPADAVTVDLMALTVSDDEAIKGDGHSHGSDGAHAHANVHVWTDPTIALRWVTTIRDQLAAIDPAGAEVYTNNAATLTSQIEALHEATIAATATVPDVFRTLVVYHDSWSYFGRTYGYEVLGALQAADFAEPSAAEVAAMVRQIREAGVPAFFGAAVFPTEVLQRVSEEANVPYVADLADDELPGSPGEPRHGYVGMMVENVRNIVTSLGGDATALDAVAL